MIALKYVFFVTLFWSGSPGVGNILCKVYAGASEKNSGGGQIECQWIETQWHKQDVHSDICNPLSSFPSRKF